MSVQSDNTPIGHRHFLHVAENDPLTAPGLVGLFSDGRIDLQSFISPLTIDVKFYVLYFGRIKGSVVSWLDSPYDILCSDWLTP